MPLFFYALTATVKVQPVKAAYTILQAFRFVNFLRFWISRRGRRSIVVFAATSDLQNPVQLGMWQ